MKSLKHVNIALFVPHEGCPNQCVFCNQRSISGSTKRLTGDDVRSAVETALDSRDSMDAQLAFFGGSFTAIEREYMTLLLDAAAPYVLTGRLKGGIRVSTRPDAVDPEILSILSHYGVKAIELGCQSMNDSVLALSKRGHTAQDIIDACTLIKQHGFELGVQMMTGLPGDSDSGCIETAKKLVALKPDTARIYPTVVLEDTPLAALYRSGEYQVQTLDEAIGLCSTLLDVFSKAGVPVIRLGLHSGGNVEQGYVAGVYHPAFRELCEGEGYFNCICDELGVTDKSGLPRASQLISGGTDESVHIEKHIHVSVAKGKTSAATGHKRINSTRLAMLGFALHVHEDERLHGGELILSYEKPTYNKDVTQ